MSDAPCGTTAGRARHQTRNENPCGPCREAKREYQRQWRATQPAKTPNQAIIAALVAGQKVRANQAERRAAAQILTRSGRSKSQIAGQLEISTATVRRARAAMREETREEGREQTLRHDAPHFIASLCACLCPACYDTGTKSLDDICRCARCPCENSDHTAQLV